LVSIAETYVTYGNDIEKSNAMLLSLLVNWEKIWYAINSHCDAVVTPPYPGMFVPKTINYKDDNHEYILKWDDTRKNLFNRLHQCLSNTPILYSLFNKTIFSFMKWEEFALNRLDETSNIDIKSEIYNLMVKC
jgi:hypothetical protein